MKKKPEYPLKQLAFIKKKRLDEAERELKRKKEALEKEITRLKELEEEKNEKKRHKDEKLEQLREELDKGTTTDKIQTMKRYLKVVDEELIQKQKKVNDQQKVVKTAEDAVETARLDMLKKQQEVEKLEIHENEWTVAMKKEFAIEEAKEADEIGNTLHSLKKRKG